jgi:hypothetical protein
MNKSMILITGTWANGKTFKMIPATPESPYNEAIFDPEAKVLALIGKEKKQSLHMLAKLNDFGDPQTMKIGKRSNGKDYAEERKTIETYYEYYIESPEEIKNIIHMLALNADTFDYNQYIDVTPKVAEKPSNIITV